MGVEEKKNVEEETANNANNHEEGYSSSTSTNSLIDGLHADIVLEYGSKEKEEDYEQFLADKTKEILDLTSQYEEVINNSTNPDKNTIHLGDKQTPEETVSLTKTKSPRVDTVMSSLADVQLRKNKISAVSQRSSFDFEMDVDFYSQSKETGQQKMNKFQDLEDDELLRSFNKNYHISSPINAFRHTDRQMKSQNRDSLDSFRSIQSSKEGEQWKVGFTEEGKSYYYNTKRQFSTWHSGDENATNASTSSSSSCSLSKMKKSMDEWKAAYTESGKMYFYNRKTRTTSWKRPSEDKLTKALDIEKENIAQNSKFKDQPFQLAITSSSLQQKEDNEADTLHCLFCGKSAISSNLLSHMQVCEVYILNKTSTTSLYSSAIEVIQKLINQSVSPKQSFLKSNEAPLKVPHDRNSEYAVSSSIERKNEKNEKSIKDKLQLLRSRSNGRRSLQPQSVSNSNGSGLNSISSEFIKSKRRATLSSIRNTEKCRHCDRVFAKGRCSIHEQVCRSVFRTKTIADSASSKTISKSKEVKRKSLVRGTRKKFPNETLQSQFHKHQASLVECPHCERKFAPSGAQQHISICKEVENKPKKPILSDNLDLYLANE